MKDFNDDMIEASPACRVLFATAFSDKIFHALMTLDEVLSAEEGILIDMVKQDYKKAIQMAVRLHDYNVILKNDRLARSNATGLPQMVVSLDINRYASGLAHLYDRWTAAEPATDENTTGFYKERQVVLQAMIGLKQDDAAGQKLSKYILSNDRASLILRRF